MSEAKHTPGPWQWSVYDWRNEPDFHGNLYVAGDFHEDEPDEDDAAGSPTERARHRVSKSSDPKKD